MLQSSIKIGLTPEQRAARIEKLEEELHNYKTMLNINWNKEIFFKVRDLMDKIDLTKRPVY